MTRTFSATSIPPAPGLERLMAGGFARLAGTVLSVFLLAFPAAAVAQSSRELRTLLFEPVYVDDPERILLSSGTGTGAGGPDPSATSQSRSPSEILEDIRRYEESINTLIESGGTYDPVLAQEYLAAGGLYEQLGDRESAVTAYENAMHINRVNQGLFTLSQADAVRALIDFNKTTRNFNEADKYHEYLYYLMSRNLDPESDQLVAAALEWADWNMEAYRRQAFLQEEDLVATGDVASIGASMLRRGELIAIEDDQFSEILFVPRTALLGGAPGGIRMQSYTAEQLVDPRLKRAGEVYDSLLENTDDNLDALHKKADITYLYKNQLEQYIGTGTFATPLTTTNNRLVRTVSTLRRGYSDNRELLEEYALSKEESDPVQAARAYLDIGDWDLAFGRRNRAENTYNKARELLLAQGMSETEITEFITPEPALLIPAFASHEYTREFQGIPESTDIPYVGYMDVNFDKRTSGSLRRIEIENASENTSQQIRARLLDFLRDATMRPQLVAGETVPQSDIKVRYYYSY